MSRYWSPVVETLQPYVAGEQPRMENLVKLNTNEHPYGPSPHALAAITAAASRSLRLYPDPSALALRTAIAESYGLSPEEVFVGNGSDEVLAHTFQALLKHDAPLLFPDISYSFYPAYCRLYGIAFEQIALDENLAVQIADYRRPSGAIILPNPNAPTGIALGLDQIERLVADHPDQPVVIDEAYVDFGAQSAVSLVRNHPNLLVVQTFSKSRGLAGLRIGFAIGQRPLMEALERVKDSFNSYPLDRLAQEGGLAAWQDRDWFEQHCEMIVQTRERLSATLGSLGFHILPSSANFVFAAHATRSGAELAAALKARAILVRHFNKPRIDNYLRISIGTDAECERLVEALEAILTDEPTTA
ncbi:histidinol-phosphate transaminase [Oryzifoliimicrobium ureilyticus]|uniref:histidinol-phosphate transaminase n=1 Tax=Oryzifoliimicrobium ureilyticus TaxID=3113724 RepID=UPI0030763D7D